LSVNAYFKRDKNTTTIAVTRSIWTGAIKIRTQQPEDHPELFASHASRVATQCGLMLPIPNTT